MSLKDDKITVNRWNFIKTGILLISLGLIFLYDRNFFFYPPYLAPAWNNIWVDSIGLTCGAILMFIGIINKHIDWIVLTTLDISVVFLTVLLVAEGWHVVGVGYFRFHPILAFEIYTIINLMQMSHEYVPNKHD